MDTVGIIQRRPSDVLPQRTARQPSGGFTINDAMAASLVAIVDDEPPVRTAFAHLLGAAGFKVSTFGSGGEFLQWVREGRPDCAVLDLHMPGLTGYDVLQCLRGMASTLPVVVVTGNDQPPTREKVMAAGAAAYLRKPITGAVLLGAVSNAIDHTGSKVGADASLPE